MTSKYRPGNLAAALFGAASKNEDEDSSSSDEEVQPTTAVEKMVVTHTRAEEQRKEEKHKERVEQKKKIQEKLSTVKQKEEECPRTLYIGNAPLTATRDKIRNIFHHYGKVESVRIRNVLPQNQKMSKRAAAQTGKFSELQKSLTFYVKYEKEESVKAALASGKHELDGHQLIITSAADIKYDPDCSVFVGNLHLKITEDDLIKHFTPVVDVNAVRVVRDKNSHEGIGIAFVRLSDPTLLKKALTLNGSQLLGREIRVTKISKKKNKPNNDNRKGRKFNKRDRNDTKNDKNRGVLPRSKNIHKKFKKRTHKGEKKRTIMS